MALQESASLYPIRNIFVWRRGRHIASGIAGGIAVACAPVLLCSPLCSSALVLLCTCSGEVGWYGALSVRGLFEPDQQCCKVLLTVNAQSTHSRSTLTTLPYVKLVVSKGSPTLGIDKGPCVSEIVDTLLIKARNVYKTDSWYIGFHI